MRGWLAASSEFLTLFDEIVIWGNKSTLVAPNVRFEIVSKGDTLGPLASFHFSWEVKRRFKKLSPSYLSETLIQCTGCTVPFADLRLIHFWNLAFMEASKKHRNSLKIGIREKLFRKFSIFDERHALKRGNTNEWWCVSRGVAAPIRDHDKNSATFRFIPNAYDADRFNLETRSKWRESMRKQYGLGSDEIVFCFSAFGHFERKGLRLAAAVVDRLAKSGLKVKLLIVGGKPTVIHHYRKLLTSSGIDLQNLIFVGMVNDMEQHLSAADALLFPSHFEAFSLAEIEAAAMGLRLYLTDHPGQEMILREGINGRLLPWGIDDMFSILSEEIRSGQILNSHTEMGEALTIPNYRSSLRQHYEDAILAKWPLSSSAS